MAEGSKIKDSLALFRSALTGGEQDFTRGSLQKAVVLLAIPMVLEMGMESLFAVVDVFFVAKLGARAVAAIGLTEGALMLLYAFALGLSMPATAMVARRIGEGQRALAAQAAVQALVLALMIGLLFGAVGVTHSRHLLELMGGDRAVTELGAGYARVMLGSAPIVILLMVFGAVFRGAGEANHAMRALWLANGLNIILDPCLIFGLGPFPELGLFGAGVATTFGRSVGVLYFLFQLLQGAGPLRVKLADLRVVPRVLADLCKLSVGSIAQFLVETSSWVMLVRIVALFGSTAVAGYTVAIRIVIFALMPAWGFSNAAATLVGQNLGAQQPERARKSVLLAGSYNMAFLSMTALVLVVFAPAIIGTFTEEPPVLALGVTCLRTVSVGFVAFAWGMVWLQAFNGAGDTKTPLLINLVCFWAVKLPLAYALAVPLGLGPFGVFLAVSVAYTLSALLGFWVFRRGHWQAVRV